ATGDHTGTGSGRLQQHTTRSEHTRRLMGDGGAVLGNAIEILLRPLDALLNRHRDLVRLPVADAHDLALVADDDERGEREPAAALDDLGDAVDLHDAFLEVESGC